MVCRRTATNASCSGARARACAWTLPVATHGTPSRRGQRGQPAVARAVVAQEGALQLDAQALGPERLAQPPQRRLVVDAGSAQPLRQTRPSACSSTVAAGRRADAVGGRHAGRGRVARGFVARVRVRAGEDAGKVATTAASSTEQRQVAAVVEVELGAVDRPQARAPGAPDGELHRARDRVVVGQRERLIAQRERRGHELVGQRGPVEERERRMAVQLHVHRTYVRIRRVRIQALRGRLQSSAILAGMSGGVVMWDFEGTLAMRPGLWSTCILEVLDEHVPGHAVSRDEVRAAISERLPLASRRRAPSGAVRARCLVDGA